MHEPDVGTDLAGDAAAGTSIGIDAPRLRPMRRL
jgi:hypothetical protein